MQDLHARGMMENTLVLVWGEFGRTPRINKDAGRDHWPGAQSVVFAGGGLKMGQAIGVTDAKAEYPKERPLTPEDVISTMYSVLGIDQELQFMNEAQTAVENPQQRRTDQGVDRVIRTLRKIRKAGRQEGQFGSFSCFPAFLIFILLVLPSPIHARRSLPCPDRFAAATF